MKYLIKERSEYFIFLLVVIIAALGLNILLAATSYIAHLSFEDQFYYVKRKAVFLLLGTAVMIVFSQIPYQYWQKISWPIFGISLVLLILLYPELERKRAGQTVGSLLPEFPYRPRMWHVFLHYGTGEIGAIEKRLEFLRTLESKSESREVKARCAQLLKDWADTRLQFP